METENLYASCAEVLSLSQSIKDNLEALLDPVTGFAPRLRQICRDQVAAYEDLRNPTSHEAIELLRLEENTWGLLQTIMPLRKLEPPQFQTARELLSENPYVPTSSIAQAVMNSSPLLQELIIVREWLQETAPPPQHPEANTGYWKFTKHSVMQSLRTGNTHKDNLVKDMNPDAINKEEGRGLAADDASYEKTLLQALYAYIRAGRLDDAVELCRKAHQPWRAASIRGSLVLHWRALSTERRYEDSMDEEDLDGWSGNRNRKLWKATCTRAALSSSLPDYERVLYAALAPSPQTSAVLKSSCRTWEDHLWAQVCIMCEEKQSMELQRLGGSFWDGGMTEVEKGVREISSEEEEKEEDEWEKEVVGTLESLKDIPVADGPSADHAFHFSQLLVVLDRTGVLLDAFAGGLQDGSYVRSSFEYPFMCRFFAHLCLFLQMIDIPVPPLATQIILEAYLQVLEEAGQRDLIAMYAGALGDNAVERYAMFLVSLELSADINERRSALLKAKDHGLDMERVAMSTAEKTIDKSFEILPDLEGPLPSIIAMQPPPSDGELFLIRSIEWTTFLEATYDVALEQANVILRYLLGAGRVQIAQRLLDVLPTELASISEPEERATEYLHYRQFFVIWETLEAVVECQALEVPGMTKEGRTTWLENYKELVDQAYDQITKLLTTEWLVTEVDNGSSESYRDIIRVSVYSSPAKAGARRADLVRIRQIYVPELILRLHVLLYTSRHIAPKYLKRALELVNIVADSRYKLYEDFVNEEGRRLGDYLGAVRQAVLGGLENGGSDPFRIMTAN